LNTVFSILATSMLIVTGCTKSGKAVFCNSLPVVINVTVSSSVQTNRTFQTIIQPGESWAMKGVQGLDRISVSINDRSYARRFIKDDSDGRYSAPGEFEIHFLVTSEDIYRIPREFRKRWRERIDEIQVPEGKLPAWNNRISRFSPTEDGKERSD